MYGEIDGILKTPLDKLATKVNIGDISEPIVLSAQSIQELNQSGSDLKKSFDKGIPVIIPNPGTNLDDLQAILGTDIKGEMGSNVAAYAINREPNGELWQITLYDSAEPTPATLLTDKSANDPKEPKDSVAPKYADSTSDSDISDAIMKDLLQWISESQKRDAIHLERLNASDNVSDEVSENKLTSLASKFVDTFVYYVGNPKPNSLVVNTFAYSCYTEENSLNWFLVEQYCVFSASNQYTSNLTAQQGWYAQIYGVNTYVSGYEGPGSVSNVNLIQSSPSTTTGSKTVTSGVSYSLSGTVSYSKGSGAGGSVTGGMTVSNSTTVSIPDVTVQNDVNNVNNANWNYTMPCCSGVDDGCVNSINKPALVSTSTFEPRNQWIWQVSDAVRNAELNGLPLVTVLSNRLINTYMNDCNMFGCDCDVNQQIWDPANCTHAANIPFPSQG